MIDFYADWCGACKFLDEITYAAPEVVAESQRSVNVKVNTDERVDLAGRYQISGLPTIVWIDARGTVIDRLEGAAPPDMFLQWMRAVHSKTAPGS